MINVLKHLNLLKSQKYSWKVPKELNVLIYKLLKWDKTWGINNEPKNMRKKNGSQLCEYKMDIYTKRKFPVLSSVLTLRHMSAAVRY